MYEDDFSDISARNIFWTFAPNQIFFQPPPIFCHTHPHSFGWLKSVTYEQIYRWSWSAQEMFVSIKA